MEEKGKDYFAALYEVARFINASLEPSAVMQEIVKCVAKTIQAKACSLRLLDSKGQKLFWGASYGLSKGYIRKGTVLVKESGLDQKALAGQTIYIRDAQTDKLFQYRGKAKTEGIKSILVVPLMVDKQAVGVLRVYSGALRDFDSDEIKFMEAAANLSAIALENARLHQALQTDFELVLAHKYRLDDN
ncbi:MAG: GAF domain-containing protein [Proteobacteria bacterium]|nr:GAF domain-containing protein [Pseudomonadota bacterium]